VTKHVIKTFTDDCFTMKSQGLTRFGRSCVLWDRARGISARRNCFTIFEIICWYFALVLLTTTYADCNRLILRR